MHLPPLLPFLLLVTLALAGCLAGDEGAPLDAGATSGATAEGETAPADGSAPSSQPPASGSAQPAAADQPAADAQAEPALVEESLLWNGNLGTGACAPAGLGGCMSPARVGGSWYHFAKLGGEPKAAELVLTWSATGPHDQNLRLLLLEAEGNEDSWSGSALAVAEGPSPLALSAADLALEPGRSLVVAVRPVSLVPDPLYAYVENGVSFQAEGLIAVQPAS